MNNETPEAALRSRIADLEQQLKLSDEGCSRLAARCLDLEKEVQSYLAAHPQREMHTDSPTLLQPLLYFDAGFGFSERDTLTAPDYVCDELTGTVTATFELPTAAQALRFDPGELPCCITNLSFSDDRLLCVPANGLTLPGNSILFLGDDPNFRLEGLTHYPAGMKLVVSYCYFPLETLTDEPLFNAVLEGVQHFQKTRNSEARHIQQLEQTNAAYALAKISGLKYCEYLNRQYGTDYISVMPTNLYGPNDNYHPTHSHVVPALIRRFHEAKEQGLEEVTCWGDGTPLREFLYVDDLANLCVFLMNNYSGNETVNAGTGKELTIRELTELVAKTVGYEGRILWDTSKPNGTPRKLLDVSKSAALGWKYRVELEEGLKLSYEDFLSNPMRAER